VGEARMQAVVVELDFMEPLLSVRCHVDDLGQLRPHPLRQGGRRRSLMRCATGHTRLLQDDRLDQARIGILDVADARAIAYAPSRSA